MIEWVACTLEPNVVFRWIECHPAVTQSGATILAIMAAAGGPFYLWQRERTERAQERRAASVAFATSLLQPASTILVDTARVGHAIKTLKQQPIGSPTIPDVLRSCKLRIPSEVNIPMQQAYTLDDKIVGSVISCIWIATTYNGVVDQLVWAAADDVQRFESDRANTIQMLSDTLEALRQRFEHLTGLRALR
jgi:hypothetical protein